MKNWKWTPHKVGYKAEESRKNFPSQGHGSMSCHQPKSLFLFFWRAVFLPGDAREAFVFYFFSLWWYGDCGILLEGEVGWRLSFTLGLEHFSWRERAEGWRAKEQADFVLSLETDAAFNSQAPALTRAIKWRLHNLPLCGWSLSRKRIRSVGRILP